MNGKRKDYSPQQLYTFLRSRVIGQDDYLKKLSTTVWLHNRRIGAKDTFYQSKSFQKHNLLVIGSTGSGKTMAMNLLADLYGLDVLVTDMSAFTGSGWKGRDSTEMITDLYYQCDQDRKRAERAIIVFDEIDKAILQNNSTTKDSFAVEHSLLKLIEGTRVDVGKTYIDTKDILFIGAGAFEGIIDIVKRRTHTKTIGFLGSVESDVMTEKEAYQRITKEDLKSYGMGAQLLGRFSDLAVLNKLEEEDLVNILMHSKASIVQSLDMTLRRSCGLRVFIDQAGAEVVAASAVREGTGARGISQIILPLIHEVLFTAIEAEVGEICLTAKNGELTTKVTKLEREKPVYSGNFSGVYSFPKQRGKNIEHFSWQVLSVYLEEEPKAFGQVQAMHNLLCSMVFYLLMECGKGDHTFTSLQKLANTAVFVPGKKETVYEKLLHDAKKHVGVPEYVKYYQVFRHADPQYKTVPLLQEALARFTEDGTFIGGTFYRNPTSAWCKKLS